MHRLTDEQGFHQLCCVADGEGNNLRGVDGERLHIGQRLTDEQVLNSPTLKTVRAQMTRGEWPAACERCRQAEESGAISVRGHMNQRFAADSQDALLARTREDGSLKDPVVRYADIRLGNVCNLTCRMCGPLASRLWSPHYNEVQPKAYRIPGDELKVLGGNNWVKDESLAWLLEQTLPTVDALHFAGGEPLIVPEMAEALELCIRSGRAGEIELSYNTNLTVLPEKVTSLWRHFRHVSLLCSVDGYGILNGYIRRPSRWSDIDRNLKLLDSHFDEWNIRWAVVSATIQIYNVLSIRDLFEYLRNSGFSRLTPLPQLVPLFTPRYLSIQSLPPAAKAEARRRLQAEIERAEDLHMPDVNLFTGSIRTTLAFMEAADTTSDLPDFFAFCKSSDRAFEDNWREAAPELAEYLNGWEWKTRLLRFAGFGG
jgi:sulfatase maturation enzyme AslB (radical SAM superfamily)